MSEQFFQPADLRKHTGKWIDVDMKPLEAVLSPDTPLFVGVGRRSDR